MAILKIVSVFDVAAQAFGRPVFVPSEGVAVRSFSDEVNREAVDNEMNKHPEDFILYYLGTWNDSDGVILFEDKHVLITGKNVIRS